jgi:probable F420-dependent oxidoreductase
MQRIQFGFGLPTRGRLSSPENLVKLAKHAEDLGFDFISVSDHVVIPRAIGSRYPYSATGEFAVDPSGAYLEQLTVLTYIAACSQRLRLLTSVMVVPQRPPVLTAKQLASLDVLSNGRLIFGVGAGWLREEFEALDAPWFDQRGRVTDEYLRAFKELWTNDEPTFDGDFASFHDIAFAPKPVQKPHPPIWVGGESNAALRRTARLGDAWYPIGSNPRHPLGTTSQLAAAIDRLRGFARQAGRDPAEIDIAYSAGWYNDRDAELDKAGHRRSFTGSPRQVADDVLAFAALGVRHFGFGMTDGTLDGSLARLERFATFVRPLIERA